MMLSFRYSGRYLFCYFIHLSVFYRIGSQNDSLGFFCLVLLGTYLLCIDDDAHIVEKKISSFIFMSNLCSKRRCHNYVTRGHSHFTGVKVTLFGKRTNGELPVGSGIQVRRWVITKRVWYSVQFLFHSPNYIRDYNKYEMHLDPMISISRYRAYFIKKTFKIHSWRPLSRLRLGY